MNSRVVVLIVRSVVMDDISVDKSIEELSVIYDVRLSIDNEDSSDVCSVIVDDVLWKHK
jgi:hypothetical protein